MPLSPTDYSFESIDTQEGLQKVVSALKKTDRVCLDLEADSMHHYYAKICLLQVLTEEHAYLIDPLAGLDLSDFLKELSSKWIIAHGSDYDLRMLFQHYQFRPAKLFDTVIAAQLLGKTSIGLAALVQSYFGVTLVKEHQKADWSIRPLSPEMLQYGAQDTFYLPGLFEKLSEELEAKGRLSWHSECCDELIKVTALSKTVDLENSWRIEGASKFSPRQLCVLKYLWLCRESMAQSRDLPSYRILPSEILLRFALNTPETGEPERVPTLPSRLSENIRQRFQDDFRKALKESKENWPQPIKIVKKTPKSPNAQLLAQLKTIRDQIAQDLGIDPSLLINRSNLTAVALTSCVSREKISAAAHWMKWQENLLVEDWLKVVLPSESLE